MGLFDMFKTKQAPKLDAKLGFACAMIYALESDGIVDESELIRLFEIFEAEDLEIAMDYMKHVKYEDFLKECQTLFTYEQAKCLIANICDIILSDGYLSSEEEELFVALTSAVGLKNDDVASIVNTFSIKYNYNLFK